MSLSTNKSMADRVLDTVGSFFSAEDPYEEITTQLTEREKNVAEKELELRERETQIIVMSSQLQEKREKVEHLHDTLKSGVFGDSIDEQYQMLSSEIEDRRLVAMKKLEDEIVQLRQVTNKKERDQLHELIISKETELADRIEKLHEVNESFAFLVQEAARYQQILRSYHTKIEEAKEELANETVVTYAYAQKMKKTVVINVCGTKFEVSTQFLIDNPDTLLGDLITDKSLKSHSELRNGEFFFDANPDIFPYILEAMRTGEINFPYSYQHEPVMVRKLAECLEIFRIRPHVINYNDHCIDVEVDIKKVSSGEIGLIGRSRHLIPWMLVDELCERPENLRGVSISLTGVTSVLLTFNHMGIDRIFMIDLRKIDHDPKSTIYGTFLETRTMEMFHMLVDLTTSNCIEQIDDEFGQMIIKNTICDQFDIPHGSVMKSLVCCVNPIEIENWELTVETMDGILKLNKDTFLKTIPTFGNKYYLQ